MEGHEILVHADIASGKDAIGSKFLHVSDSAAANKIDKYNLFGRVELNELSIASLYI